MKNYLIEVRRVSYINIHVQAPDEDTAQELAWEQIDSGQHGRADKDADFEIVGVHEQGAE